MLIVCRKGVLNSFQLAYVYCVVIIYACRKIGYLHAAHANTACFIDSDVSYCNGVGYADSIECYVFFRCKRDSVRAGGYNHIVAIKQCHGIAESYFLCFSSIYLELPTGIYCVGKIRNIGSVFRDVGRVCFYFSCYFGKLGRTCNVIDNDSIFCNLLRQVIDEV